ncbi:transferrin-binding protein-like solute binding protein [Pelagibacterium xiamenense]|uniref:transferrin-binding protein-like solute binding protein n=1 Tax=Pelagibacterium xiamenense TaxID=2901140 RepID=UPI001E36DFEE|nr:transferrin-binding protein-like solute binding protein [Pelagibacterium xiamenense]MCD7060990.1 transferrin-binding protein-like solute binding protein [Pelagibacterium xiamenense]
MENSRIWILGCTAIVGAALGGCASTGGGGGGGATLNAVYAEDAGTVGEALASGETLMAYTSSMSLSAVRENGVWQSDPASPQFSLVLNDEGGIDVTIDGKTVSFTAADLSGEYGWESGDDGVFTWSADSAQQALDGDAFGQYHQVWSYFWHPEDTMYNGFAVIGTETTPDAVAAQSASATYSGWAAADAYFAGSESDTRTRLFGDLALAADFDAGTIGGTMSNIGVRVRSDGDWGATTDLDGTIALETSSISGNGYSGTLAPDATLESELAMEDFEGGYGGKFYGPDAEEAGGTLGFTGVSDGDAVVGAGFFTALQD